MQDVTGVAVAELPTSGFVSLARYTPYLYTSNAVELSTHDSQGIRTGGKGYALKNQAGTGLAELRPAALRLTTDGGALVVAHVNGDGPLNDHGLWITKLPARTFDAPFDPTFVQPTTSIFPGDACTLDVTAASVSVEDIAMDGVDVTSRVASKVLAPAIQKRTQ